MPQRLLPQGLLWLALLPPRLLRQWLRDASVLWQRVLPLIGVL
jgi:hypothetical protein